MHHRLLSPEHGFDVLYGTQRSQAATMVLAPGETTGGPDNRHERSDQWLFVLSGRGRAIVNEQRIDLEAGSLLLIEAGETHEIECALEASMETLNIYTPPAY